MKICFIYVVVVLLFFAEFADFECSPALFYAA
jgi:hypothetical protein